MRNLIIISLFFLFSFKVISQEYLHQVWICMDTYHKDGGGFTYGGVLYDFENENELISGNILYQYFKTRNYHVSGKLILNGENDTIATIEYLSKEMLKLKFYGGDIGIFKPLNHKINLDSNFEKVLINNSWQYWHNDVEKRVEFFDEIAIDSCAPKICLRKEYDEMNIPFENRIWTLTNYKNYILIALSVTPATSEIFEITDINKNFFHANVIHRNYMSTIFKKCRNNKRFEKEFYSKLDSVEVKIVTALSKQEEENFIRILEKRPFTPSFIEKSGGRNTIRKNIPFNDILFTAECVDQKRIVLRASSDTLILEDCNGIKYVTSFRIAPDGKYFLTNLENEFVNTDIPEVEYSNEKLVINYWIKVRSNEDCNVWNWYNIKFE